LLKIQNYFPIGKTIINARRLKIHLIQSKFIFSLLFTISSSLWSAVSFQFKSIIQGASSVSELEDMALLLPFYILKIRRELNKRNMDSEKHAVYFRDILLFSIFSFAEDYYLPTFYDASAKQIALEAVYVQKNCQTLRFDVQEYHQRRKFICYRAFDKRYLQEGLTLRYTREN
jgi:hypothetical protein